VATLIVRKVDDEVARRLKERARAAGRSAEAEHRRILEEALRPKMTGAEFLALLRGDGPFLTDEEVEIINNACNQPVELPDPFE
jgi:plasmid stability protein